MTEPELVIASSPTDAGIGCWDLNTGGEHLRYRSCSSPSHGLTCVGGRFLASSQLRDTKSSSGSIIYWSWNKPQVEVKSFPAEPINPLVSNSEGTYIAGGGASGDIYLWQVWSLLRGKLLRNIVFPSIIDAIALDPGEDVFYAGGRDGKIYIAALNAVADPNNNYGLHILGFLSEQSKAITCLALSMDGSLLISGSDDGMVRVWNTKNHNIARIFRHAKGPVNNIVVVRQPSFMSTRGAVNSQVPSVKRHGVSLAPPLEKYANSADENDYKAVIGPQIDPDRSVEASYISIQTLNNQILELQRQGSSAAAEMEIERLKLDCSRSMQMIQQWEKKFQSLHQFCVTELLDGEQAGNA